MDVTNVVREHYDNAVEREWARIEGRPEFIITTRFLERYIQPGQRVLDIGGGPGRYSLWLAERGCDVTLVDLSPQNVAFAKAQAQQRGLTITALAGDARDDVAQGEFDHVLLMGPLYHLQAEADRVKAVEAALRRLRVGGALFVSFIQLYAGLIYALTDMPELILAEREKAWFEAFVTDADDFMGRGFTQVYNISPREVAPFMARFPLEKLHLFGQEGGLSPFENKLREQQPPEVMAAWLDFAEKMAEREDFLNWSEHLMYVGRKRGECC